MATKVGEGYIEIKPRLTGFNRDLLREVRRKIKDLEDASKEAQASVIIKPKIQGITKAWQREVQRELNEKIKGLTVDVNVKLENKALKATFNGFTVEAKDAGAKAGRDLSNEFKGYIGEIHKQINSANIALKSGFKFADDPTIQQSVKTLKGEFQDLAASTQDMSREEVRAANIAANSWKTLSNAVERETAKATKDVEDSVNRTIRATERLSENIKVSDKISKSFDLSDDVWGIASSLEQEIRDANLIADTLFPDLEERLENGMVDPFKKSVAGIRREMGEVEIAVREGFRRVDDAHVIDAMSRIDGAIKNLSQDTSQYSDEQVASLKRVTTEHERLARFLSSEASKGSKDYERAVESAIKATDRLSERIRASNEGQRGLDKANSIWNLAKTLSRDIQDAETYLEAKFPDLNERLAKQGEKGGSLFSGAFAKALRSNFFDNIAEGVLGVTGQFLAWAVVLPPLITLLGNVASALTILGTAAANVYGSMAALPAVWSLVAQASVVLTAAFWGVEDALTALGNEDQHAAANATNHARQIKSAQQQIADAKERLKRTTEAANESIKRSEEALVDAQESAAERIASAQDRVAEARASAAESVESANKRIVDAQKALSRAYESAADRIASAEKRHIDTIKRVRDAQLDLNDAYKDALRRFRDLNTELGNAVLSEEGAKLAIERAREKLLEVIANEDDKFTDLDRREADLAYRQSLQRLNELQIRNGDLKDEIAEANRTGIEGSKEVTNAKQKLLDAIEAEKEAQAEIAKAHKDASEQIMDAQERVSEAQAAAIKSQLDGMKRIQEAEKDLAKAREDAAERVQDAQKNLAEAHKNAARQIADAQKDVKRALEGLTEAQNKQSEQWYNARYAMSQLSPEAQKFVQYLNDTFIPKLKEVQFNIQDAFFPPIRDALEKSGGLIDLFDEKLTSTAGLLGFLIGDTIKWLNTPETQNTLGRILDINNQILGNLGFAGQHFASALLGIADAAGPFVNQMSWLVLDFATWIDDIVNSEEGRKELKEFFDNIRTTIIIISQIIKPLGKAIYSVYKQAQPHAEAILRAVKDIAERFEKWVQSPEGKTKIEDFLENGERFLKSVLKLAEKVAKAFFDWASSKDMSTVIDDITEHLLPAIEDLLNVVGGDEGTSGLSAGIKILSAVFEALAWAISLTSLAVATFKGDSEGAREALAQLATLTQRTAQQVWGKDVPDGFNSSLESFKGWVNETGSQQYVYDENTKSYVRMTDDMRKQIEEMTGKGGKSFELMNYKIREENGKLVLDTVEKTAEVKDKGTANWQGLSDNSKAIYEGYVKDVKEKHGEAAKATDEKTKAAADAATRNAELLVGETTKKLKPLPDVFDKAGKDGQQKLRDQQSMWGTVSQGIVDGLINGIKAAMPTWIGTIWDLGVAAVTAAKNALESKSPSKKFERIGKDVGAGLIGGIKSMHGQVTSATKELAQSVTKSFGAPSLEIEVGATGRKAVPTLGAIGSATGITGGPRNVNYINVTAAPTVPTEKQISNILKYQDALYG